MSRDSLPKAPKARSHEEVPPTDRHGVKYKAPPVPVPPSPQPGSGAPQSAYKGPPRRLFVQNIRGEEGPPKPGAKAPPPTVTGNRHKLAYHAWAKQARADESAEAAASGAASSSSSARPRVLASCTEATIVFDWHQVLDKAWIENRGAAWETKRGSHGYFNVDFLESLKASCEEHKPLRIAILSYCSPTNAAWYQHHFLEEALFCFREALPSSTNLSNGQTFQRTGPDGKAQQLSKIVPPASLIIDDNNGIVKECRKTGALVIHASKGGGADQLIFELGRRAP